MTVPTYLRPSVSNGNPDEQRLIRQWWHEQHAAQGMLVWEYYLGECYLDAMWFPDAEGTGSEHPGEKALSRFPIAGKRVVLCEAKRRSTHGLIGQALVYGAFARQRGAQVESIVIFAVQGSASMKAAATELGLDVVIPEQP